MQVGGIQDIGFCGKVNVAVLLIDAAERNSILGLQRYPIGLGQDLVERRFHGATLLFCGGEDRSVIATICVGKSLQVVECHRLEELIGHPSREGLSEPIVKFLRIEQTLHEYV